MKALTAAAVVLIVVVTLALESCAVPPGDPSPSPGPPGSLVEAVAAA